jgi:hypothetical protein
VAGLAVTPRMTAQANTAAAATHLRARKRLTARDRTAGALLTPEMSVRQSSGFVPGPCTDACLPRDVELMKWVLAADVLGCDVFCKLEPGIG